MKIIISSLLTISTIFYFSSLEDFFQRIGISWTLSKSLPYLFLIALGLFIALLFTKKAVTKNMKRILFLLILPLPFIIGFAFHPIYEGDFSKNGIQLTPLDYQENTIKDGLIVITIPNCPYCYESISKIKKLALRNPKLQIEYVVCSSDTNDILTYQAEIDGLFDIHLAKDKNKLAKIADLSFPAFVQVKNNKQIYKWSNSQFGVRAMDVIEDCISNSLKNN
jgi:hypothetical protein